MSYVDSAATKSRARPRRSRKFNPAPADVNRLVVKHDYHDHSHDKSNMVNGEDDGSRRKGPRGGVTVPFPTKLHLMLSKVEAEGLDRIVSWQPHGRCFLVHKPQEFVDQIMPTFFRQSKLTSFQRQLNLYGFSRITAGRDRGGYYHELFLKNKLFLCQNMTRIRIKGTGIKGKASPSTEPDFYSMPPILPEDEEERRTLEEELEAAMVEENRRMMKSSKSTPQKRISKPIPKKAVIEKTRSMPSPMVSPETPEKPTLEFHNHAHVKNNRRRLIRSQPQGDINLPFTTAQQQTLRPGDEVMFEGQHFHYMDSLASHAEAHQFSLNPRTSSVMFPSSLEVTLNEPILTPSSSSSSLNEYFQQKAPSLDFNPATVFQEKEAEIIRERYLMLA